MSLADLKLISEVDSLVAWVGGEIDMSNAGELCAAVMEATTNGLLGVVLDFSELEYLDSAGVQLIYRLRERLGTRGQELRLVIADSSPAADALRLAGATTFVKAVPTVAQALDELRAEAHAGA